MAETERPPLVVHPRMQAYLDRELPEWRDRFTVQAPGQIFVADCGRGCDDLRAVSSAPIGDRPPIADLIEASSLGTPEAQALRESVSLEDARRVVERAKRMAEDPS